MRCVFPNAIRPWQKAACAAVGVAALMGGVCAGGYAFVIGLETADKKWKSEPNMNGPVTNYRVVNGVIAALAGIYGCASLAE
jgi:hypothetical protein